MNRRDQAAQARKHMEAMVRADPRFQYVYSPSGTRQNERWVFTDRTCLSITEAFGYISQKEN